MLMRCVTAAVAAFLLVSVSFGGDWNRFRGPNGQGVSQDTTVPLKWGDKQNLKWKRELPGPGTSSPIIVGDKVFVTCYSGYGVGGGDGKIADLKRHLVCISRKDGKILWDKSVAHKGREDRYSRMLGEHGYASNTPASDGKNVYAFFGKSGVVAFDLRGKKLWRTSVGTESGPMGWGSGASALVYKDLVIVNASEENEAIVALETKTGKQRWKAQAAGLGSCWGTPVLVKTKDRTDLVISVPNEIWGLNPDTGKLVWFADGLRARTMCASLVVDKDVVIAVGGEGSGTIAVRCGGKGDVTKTHTVWTSRTSGRINTPVLYDGHLHWVGYGIAQCLSAKDGKTAYRKRLGSGGGGNRAGGNPGAGNRGGNQGGGNNQGGGRFGRGGRFGGGGFGGGQTYNSPIVVNGNVVMFTRKGTAHVYKAGKTFKLVSTNKLTDGGDFNATPAIAHGQMFIRSNKYLYCIEATR